MCYRIGDLAFCQIEKGYLYTLDEFKGAQIAQLAEVSGPHWYEIKDLVYNFLKILYNLFSIP